MSSMDDLDSWGDIGFDQTTTYDLLAKEDDALELQTKTIQILTSIDPLREGLFNDTKIPAGQEITAESLFKNLVEDEDDESELQLHSLLSGQLQPKRTNMNMTKKQFNMKFNKKDKNINKKPKPPKQSKPPIDYDPNNPFEVAMFGSNDDTKQDDDNNDEDDEYNADDDVVLPAFALDPTIAPADVDLLSLNLSPLELTILDKQHKQHNFHPHQQQHSILSPLDRNGNNTNTNTTTFALGVRTQNGFIISTREDLLAKMRTKVINFAELCFLSEPEAESLLRYYQWDITRLQTDWLDDRHKTRLLSGVWRSADTSCYVFGIGCISHFLSHSNLISQSIHNINNTNTNNTTNNINLSSNTMIMTWSELIKQLYYYYQQLYFTKSSTSLKTTNNPSSSTTTSIHQLPLTTSSMTNNNKSIDDGSDGLLIPDNIQEIEHSLLNQHSTSFVKDLRDSFKFQTQPTITHNQSSSLSLDPTLLPSNNNNTNNNITIAHNSGTIHFPTLTSDLTRQPQSQLNERRNSISFSRLDLPLQTLYFNHAKNELSSILFSLLKTFHFPQEINLAKEFTSLQQQFIQFLDSTKSIHNPTSLSGLYNTSDSYSIELQERLHSIRQILQIQDKICPHSGISSTIDYHQLSSTTSTSSQSNHNNSKHQHHQHNSSYDCCGNENASLQLYKILETTDIPFLTTSFSLLLQNTLETICYSTPSKLSSMTIIPTINGKELNRTNTNFNSTRITSEIFLKHIILPLDAILSSFEQTQQDNPILLSPLTISQSTRQKPLLNYIFSFLQQNIFFSEQRQIASILHAKAPEYGFGENADNDPFGILAAEREAAEKQLKLQQLHQQQQNDINTSSNNNNNDDGDSNDEYNDIPIELEEWMELMQPNEIALWDDKFVDESEVIQISGFLFNLPHHSLGNTQFYIKRADFELICNLLAYQKINILSLKHQNELFAITPTMQKINTNNNNTATTTQNDNQDGNNNNNNFHTMEDEYYYYCDEQNQLLIPSEPTLDEIFELFRQTDYYSRYLHYHTYRQSLLPPGKSSSQPSSSILSFYQPSLYVQCSTAFCDIIRFDQAYALGCGHYFCRECWQKNLLHELYEQGRGATTLECIGGEYQHDHDKNVLDCTSHINNMVQSMSELIQFKEKREEYEKAMKKLVIEKGDNTNNVGHNNNNTNNDSCLDHNVNNNTSQDMNDDDSITPLIGHNLEKNNLIRQGSANSTTSVTLTNNNGRDSTSTINNSTNGPNASPKLIKESSSATLQSTTTPSINPNMSSTTTNSSLQTPPITPASASKFEMIKAYAKNKLNRNNQQITNQNDINSNGPEIIPIENNKQHPMINYKIDGKCHSLIPLSFLHRIISSCPGASKSMLVPAPISTIGSSGNNRFNSTMIEIDSDIYLEELKTMRQGLKIITELRDQQYNKYIYPSLQQYSIQNNNSMTALSKQNSTNNNSLQLQYQPSNHSTSSQQQSKQLIPTTILSQPSLTKRTSSNTSFQGQQQQQKPPPASFFTTDKHGNSVNLHHSILTSNSSQQSLQNNNSMNNNNDDVNNNNTTNNNEDDTILIPTLDGDNNNDVKTNHKNQSTSQLIELSQMPTLTTTSEQPTTMNDNNDNNNADLHTDVILPSNPIHNDDQCRPLSSASGNSVHINPINTNNNDLTNNNSPIITNANTNQQHTNNNNIKLVSESLTSRPSLTQHSSRTSLELYQSGSANTGTTNTTTGTTSLFPVALQPHTSVKRRDIQRIHEQQHQQPILNKTNSSHALLNQNGVYNYNNYNNNNSSNNGSGRQFKNRKQYLSAQTALLTNVTLSTQGSLEQNSFQQQSSYNGSSSSSTTAPTTSIPPLPSSTEQQTPQQQQSQQQQTPSSSQRLTLAATQSLSPLHLITPSQEEQKTAFVPEQAPILQYNKLLWWILDIYVSKTPEIKWCPNPLCDSTQKRYNHNNNDNNRNNNNNDGDDDNSDDPDVTVPILPQFKIKPIHTTMNNDQQQHEKSPYAFIYTTSVTTYQVDCLCGKLYCFRCLNPSHSPSPCDLYNKWEDSLRDKSNDMYINAKTKACPKCGVLIEKNKACNHMTCTCRHQFCWLCLKDWNGHNGSSFTCKAYNDAEVKGNFTQTELDIRRNAAILTKYEYYAERYKQHKLGIEYCEYLRSLLTITLKRTSNYILYQIIQRCNNPRGKQQQSNNYNNNNNNNNNNELIWDDNYGKYFIQNIPTAIGSTTMKIKSTTKEDQKQYVSARLNSAFASLQSSTQLNLYNLDIYEIVTGLGGIPKQLTITTKDVQYFKSVHEITSLPIYFTSHIRPEIMDLSKKNKQLLKQGTFKILRPDDISNEQLADFHDRFDFIFTALNTLIESRHVLQYAYVVAYYLKTTNTNQFIRPNTTGSGTQQQQQQQTKSQKQLFELQLKYLVEPTEKLQSYLDHLTDDITYVFFHKRIIVDLVNAITRLRKFLLTHVESDKQFEESLLYNADIDMANDIWRCSCNVDHPLTLKWCSTCLECRIHREPECKACHQ